MSTLITISGCSGAGKTALTDALAEKLRDVLVIKFDDIDSLLAWDGDFAAWLARGGDYEEFKLGPLKMHVEALIDAARATYVLFDYPYGRLHSAFRQRIDLAVFVATPLDVALARRVLRDLPGDSVEAHHWIKGELQGYLGQARPVYLTYEQQVKPTCDLVVDGTRPLAELVTTVLHSVGQLSEGGILP